MFVLPPFLYGKDGYVTIRSDAEGRSPKGESAGYIDV